MLDVSPPTVCSCLSDCQMNHLAVRVATAEDDNWYMSASLYLRTYITQKCTMPLEARVQ